MPIKQVCKVLPEFSNELQTYDASNLKLQRNQKVVIETQNGVSVGKVKVEPFQVELSEEEIKTLMKVVRIFTVEDAEKEQILIQRAKEAKIYCQNKATELGLNLTVVDVKFFFDGSGALFYFVSETRVDFRELIKDLARRFHTHIEMRQIGARDRAKIISGIGPCGRELCCSTFLKAFNPVTIKHVKPQGLPQTQYKLTGVCGKFMCCLTYEYDLYVEALDVLPKLNKKVVTPLGNGEVVGHDIIGMNVIVLLENGEKVKFKHTDVKVKGLFG
ncbi:MAG: PSP1 domain-containing protein [bacterium]